jgi:hypothetical protein
MLEQLLDYHREFKPKTEMIVDIVKELLPHFPNDSSIEYLKLTFRFDVFNNTFGNTNLIGIFIDVDFEPADKRINRTTNFRNKKHE